MDNEYISSRLTEVDSKIKEYSQKNGNLAYSYNKDSILSAVTSIMDDPIVQDAVTSAQNKASYDKSYSELVKKDPKLANSANYQYGQYAGGYYDYMSGKTKKLGAMEYQPFVDLAEEHLKKLKTIKDIKGKRTIETVDPSNPGVLITKSIDGLEDWQINQYLGSTMSSQELGQLKINAWAKFGGVDIEKNRGMITSQYDDYNRQKIDNLQTKKDEVDAIANSAVSDDRVSEAKSKSKELEEEIADLQKNTSKDIDTTTLATRLEKASYIGSMVQIAKSEWSTEIKSNAAYNEDVKLDLARQKMALDVKKYELDVAKTQKENGVDAQGNPIGNVLSQAPMASELKNSIAEEGMGVSTLKKDHDRAYREVNSEAVKVFTEGTDEEINVTKAALKSRNVEYSGGEFKFIDAKKSEGRSVMNTVYEAYKAAGTITPEMYKASEVKKQKAAELINVKKEAYSKVFNENADDYISRLRREVRAATIDGQSSLYEDKAEEDLAKAREAEDFVSKNGGWDKLKENMQNHPEKLSEFADVLSNLTSRVQVTPTISMNWKDLKKDAASEIEKTIQKKTDSGLMMSAYNQFNILDDKVKKLAVSSIVGEEVKGGSDFDEKQNITIRKRGEDVYLEQYKTSSKGNNFNLSYKVSNQSSLYNELSKYVNLDSSSGANYIVADKNTKTEPVKVRVESFARSEANGANMMNKVNRSIPKEGITMFTVNRIAPGMLATKELASETIYNTLVSNGVSTEKAAAYRDTLLSKANSYTLSTSVKKNYNSDKNEFVMEIKDNKGDRVNESFLGVDRMSYNMKYSMEMYPQVYVLNQLLYTALRNKGKIEEEINKL